MLLGLTSQPSELEKTIRNLPGGGTFNDGSTIFEWGKVERLLSAGPITPMVAPKVLTSGQKYICHLDHLPAKRRKELELRFHLQDGSITGSLSDTKADLLVIADSGQTFLISYKSEQATAKLGQVSTEAKYGHAKLCGGLPAEFAKDLYSPTMIRANDTALSVDQFAKISNSDRRYAYIKHHDSATWKVEVKRCMHEAEQQLAQFGKTLSNDRASFIAFVGSVLGGSSKDNPDFHISLGSRLIQLTRVLHDLRQDEWSISSKDSSTPNKPALLINVSGPKGAYCLTRIEPAFDGAEADVSQTKGVIFYFQQFPREKTGSYKSLLLDIGK